MLGYRPWVYLGEKDLQRVRTYQFKAGAPTYLECVMNRFWNVLILIVPKTIAPNVLTFLGFLASLSGFFFMMVTSRDLTTSPPRFSCLIMALGVFLHQTFDALDGKQAREIRESSALGALFDHGCDVLTLTFFSISTVALFRSGLTLQSILAITVSGHVSQFLYIWWEYQFKVFCSNPGFGAGVTEAQCSIILIALFTSVMGAQIWVTDISTWLPSSMYALSRFNVLLFFFEWALLPQHLPLNTCVIACTLASNLIADGKMIYLANKQLSRRRKSLAFSQLFGFFVFVLAEISFFLRIVDRLKYFPIPGFVLLIVVYSILATRLLLSGTSEKPYAVVQKPALPFMALAFFLEGDWLFSKFFSRFLLYRICTDWFSSNFLLILWIYALGYLAFFLCMAISTIKQIANALQLYFFKINNNQSRTLRKSKQR